MPKELNMYKDNYIKKLERRIHNQRVALRDNWEIVEQRARYRTHYRKPMWWALVQKKCAEIKRLKAHLIILRGSSN